MQDYRAVLAYLVHGSFYQQRLNAGGAGWQGYHFVEERQLLWGAVTAARREANSVCASGL